MMDRSAGGGLRNRATSANLGTAAPPARSRLAPFFCRTSPDVEVCMGSLVKKRRKKMSKHKYRKRLKANRHKRKR